MGWHRHWQVSPYLKSQCFKKQNDAGQKLQIRLQFSVPVLCGFSAFLSSHSLFSLLCEKPPKSWWKFLVFAGNTICKHKLKENNQASHFAFSPSLPTFPPSCLGIITVCATCREGASYKNKWIKIAFLLYGADVPLSTLIERSSFG